MHRAIRAARSLFSCLITISFECFFSLSPPPTSPGDDLPRRLTFHLATSSHSTSLPTLLPPPAILPSHELRWDGIKFDCDLINLIGFQSWRHPRVLFQGASGIVVRLRVTQHVRKGRRHPQLIRRMGSAQIT